MKKLLLVIALSLLIAVYSPPFVNSWTQSVTLIEVRDTLTNTGIDDVLVQLFPLNAIFNGIFNEAMPMFNGYTTNGYIDIGVVFNSTINGTMQNAISLIYDISKDDEGYLPLWGARTFYRGQTHTFETTVCPDGICVDGVEHEINCPEDCAQSVCGDGYCAADEDEISCCADCGYCRKRPKKVLPLLLP